MKHQITNRQTPLTARTTGITTRIAALAAGCRSSLLKLSLACAVAALLAAAPTASAGLLAQWATAANATNASSVAANMTASTLTNASGLATWNLGAYPWVFGPNNNTATIAQAVANNQYFYLTITPTAGYVVSVTNLSFYAENRGGAIRGFTIRSSLDSYAADLLTYNLTNLWYSNVVLTTSSAFTNLPSAVTFRIYWYAATANTSFNFSNLTVSGSVAASAAPAGVPTGLAAIAGNNQVALSWTAALYDVTYNVYRSTSSGGTYTILAAGTGISTTSFTDTTAVNGTPYFYEVTALNLAAAESAPTAYVPATPVAPAAVPTFTAVTPGVNQVSLSWSTSSGATGYNVKRSTTSGSGYVTVTNNISTTSFTDATALYGGVTYYYVVSALVATTPNTFESANSAQTNAVPTGVSAVPIGLTAASDVNQVDLSWTATAGATGYNVYRSTTSGSGYAVLAAGVNVSGANFVDTTVTLGPTYYYVVTGTNAYAESAASAQASAVDYAVPTNKVTFHFDDTGLTTASDTSGGSSNVVLNLYSPFNNGATPAGSTPFDLHTNIGVGGRGSALYLPDPSGGSAAATGPVGGATITNASMGWGTISNWTVSTWFKPTYNNYSGYLTLFGPTGGTGFSVGGTTGFQLNSSNQFTAMLSGNAKSMQITLPSAIPTNQWSFVALSYDGTNFNVYYGSDSSSAVLVGSATTNASMAFGSAGLICLGASGQDANIAYKGFLDETRFYSGASGPSFVDSIRQSALTNAAPSNLVATPGAGQVGLTWTPPAVAGTVAATYNVKRSTSSGAETTLPLGTNVTGTSFTDLTTLGGTNYFYKISTVTFVGESTNSLEANATPTLALPSAPATFTVLPSNGVVFLNWSLSAGAATYNLYRSTVSGAETNNPVVIANPTSSYADTSLTNGVTYYYKITAVSGAGESLPTSELTATPNVPSAVPAVTATANANNTVTLSWGAVSNTSLTTPLTYNVKRSTSAGTEVLFTNISSAGFIDPVAYNGATYYYKVSSLNGNGEGANSTEVSATPTGVPLPPINVSPVAGAANIALSWTASIAVATGYNVYRGTSSGGEAYLTSVAGTAFNDTNVTIGTTYYYKVTGTNIYGEGLASAETNATPYGTPTMAIRMPFDETYTGSSYYTTNTIAPYGPTLLNICSMGNDTNNLTLTNIDLHGVAGSGVGGVGAALDYSSRTNQGGGGQPAYATYDKNDGNWFNNDIVTNWTASMWFKPTQKFGTAAADLFVVGGGSANIFIGSANSVGIRSLGTNVLAARVNNFTDLRFTLPTALPSNVWQFVALSYDGFTLRTYLGTETSPVTQIGTNTIAGTIIFTNTYSMSMAFGNNINSYNEVFAGLMDDFRFYSGPSDANYVETIRQSGFPPAAPVVAAAQGDTQVALTWAPVANAVGYNVYRSTSTGTETLLVNVTTNGLLDTGLANGTTYYYVVTTTNQYYEGVKSAEVFVTPVAAGTPPAVTVNPASTNVQCGSTLTLAAVSTGTPPLAYQWYDYLNNPIANATNTSVTLANLHPLQSGNYFVIVTNLSGSATNFCTLTVIDTVPPVITLNSNSSLTNLLGSTYTDPGATAVDACDGSVSVATSNAVNTAVAGVYTVTYTANDGANFATNTRTVTVVSNYLVQLDFGTPPSTVPTPAGFTKITLVNYGWGTNVTFANVAGSGYTLTFTNIRAYTANGTNFESDGFLFPGAGNHQVGYGAFSTFNLTGLPTNVQVTAYACWGWDGLGHAANFTYAGQTNQLTLGTGITSPGTNNFQNIGAMVADATGTVGGTITGASRNVNNEGEVGGMIFVVQTAAAPTATISPATATVECSKSTNLTAVAAGAGPLTYQWYDNSHSQIANATNVTLTLTNLHGAQSGSYYVTVANLAGSVAATNTVVVEDTNAPTLTANTNMTILVPYGYTGTNAYFNVVATDTCDGTATTGSTPASGSFFSPGTNTVNTYAYDTSGNTNYGSFKVIIQVLPPPLSSNAYLTALMLNPNAGFAPGFTTNGYLYYATNSYGQTPTVTVTNADATATNTLIVNGVSLGLLTNSIASAPLTLGVGSTNVVAVRVVSQDLSVTNTYVVNVTLQGSSLSTNALLTSLALTPAGTLYPAFDTGTTSYTATNTCASNPLTVTVTNADLTATNTLYLNGVSQGLLTNGVASALLTLVTGANNVTVQVVSQDLSQTNNYAVAVTLTAPPTVSVNSVTNCGPVATLLTATSSASSPSYLWSDSETTASITVTPGSTTTYTVTVTDGTTGCANSGSGTITVHPVPTVGVNSATNCGPVATLLTASTSASSPTYSWSPGGATTASITVTPGLTTIYTVTVTDGTTGCANNGSGTITVHPVPTVSVNSATNCGAVATLLTATSSASSPSYLWSPGGLTTASITVTPSSTTIYTVTVTDGTTGCANSGSGTITVNPVPTVTVNSTNIYAGGTATLAATTSASSPSYLWSPGGLTTASITVSPSTNTTYTVTVTDGTTGCANSGSGTVTILPSTNALLASLSLTPAGTLAPTFSSGTTSYNATNVFTNNPVTVAATSADANATLQLNLNGGGYGSAVTNSLSVVGNTLVLNPPANTVAVRVVSQDLSQTNIYTVNVLLQPSATVPKLTNSVSGSTLSLTWPADHLGYRLLVQTGNLSKGVSGNINDWTTVAGSQSITSTNITIIKAGVTNQYYKLVYP